MDKKNRFELTCLSRTIPDFTARLFRAAYKSGDALMSPLSVYAALSMARAGARGETLARLEAVLGPGAAQDELELYLASTADTWLYIASSIWLNERGFTPDEGFLADCARFARAEAYVRPFSPDTISEINDWAWKNTLGMIDQIVDSFGPLDVMYLLNAVAFWDRWEVRYRDYAIRPDIFHGERGDAEVRMMHSTEQVYLKGDGFTGFLKPYRSRRSDGRAGARFSFAALLPDESAGLGGFLKGLSGKTLAEALENAQKRKVITEMPAFRSESSFELAEPLGALGLEELFTDRADFSGMGEAPTGPLQVGGAKHKAFIRLDSEGTRAAAVTFLGMGPTAAYEPEPTPMVLLDRPFAYMIVDNQFNIPVFFGVVTGDAF